MGIKKLFVLLGLISVVGCAPDFKEGDCITADSFSEHPEMNNRDTSYYKIKRVGKKTYLTDYRIGVWDESIHLTEIEILYQGVYTKVQCPENLR